MILAVDIGNHKIAFALFDALAPPLNSVVVKTATVAEGSGRAALTQPLNALGAGSQRLEAAVIASVVPALTSIVREAVREVCPQVLVLDDKTPTGMPIDYHPPSDLGPDRIANALAAFHLYGGPCCSVDLGTATTFDVVSAQGHFLGGAIAPGMATAAESLYEKAARLQHPGWQAPEKALGQSTAECLLSGTVLGYAGMVDHMVRLLEEEAGPFLRVVATGGMAPFLAKVAVSFDTVRPALTLEGLNIAYHRVRGDHK